MTSILTKRKTACPNVKLTFSTHCSPIISKHLKAIKTVQTPLNAVHHTLTMLRKWSFSIQLSRFQNNIIIALHCYIKDPSFAVQLMEVVRFAKAYLKLECF